MGLTVLSSSQQQKHTRQLILSTISWKLRLPFLNDINIAIPSYFPPESSALMYGWHIFLKSFLREGSDMYEYMFARIYSTDVIYTHIL